MNKLIYSFLGALFLFGITSCAEKRDIKLNEKLRSADGYDYIVHELGDGKKIESEDLVFYSFYVVDDGGALLQRDNDPESYPIIKMLPKDPKNINPVMEIFRNMYEGDSITVIIPRDSIKNRLEQLNFNYVNYHIKIKEVIDQKEMDRRMKENEAKTEENKKKGAMVMDSLRKTFASTAELFAKNDPKIIETEYGVRIYFHQEGEGKNLEKADFVKLNYAGYFPEYQKVFDNSYERGSVLNVPVGEAAMIAGWNEALKGLRPNAKATVFIPSNLAYGVTGSSLIPPSQDLMYYIEVLDVKRNINFVEEK